MSDHNAQNGPLLVRADDAETVSDGPTSLITLLAESAGAGAVTANRATLQPGSPGAPPHFHTIATELFYVLDGHGHILAGDTVHHVSTADFLLVPPHTPHAFAPAPGHHLELLVVFTPGRARFDYYRLLERVYRGNADTSEIPASSERFDNHYTHSTPWETRLS